MKNPKEPGYRSRDRTRAVVGIINYTYTFLFQANIMPSKRSRSEEADVDEKKKVCKGRSWSKKGDTVVRGRSVKEVCKRRIG